MINPLTEILFVKEADSFVGQRKSLKITQNTTKQICMDSLVALGEKALREKT